MGAIFDFFTLVLMDPMINFLVILDQVLFGSFGLAIIAFTIIIRMVTFPLTVRQLQQTRAMQSLQPKVQELQKKFSDPKRRQQEMMKAYKEAGVNPLGCVGPMLLQFPILIALFYAVRQSLALSPEALDKLSGHLYNWSYIQNGVPLEESFLGMDLREANILMVALVGITTWAQSKTTVSTATDDKARAQQQMMAYMLPLMFMFFSFSFPSGVSLYWVVTSVVSIGFNVVTYGFPMLKIEPLIKPMEPRVAAPAIEPTPGKAPARARSGSEARTHSGKNRSKRKNRRRRS
jgi:YidC/Oxa1 family membrane protein insertase